VNAGRAAQFTGAVPDSSQGPLQEAVDEGERLGGQADTAAVAVINEDRGPLQFLVPGMGNPADIVAVAQHQQRQHGDHGMLQGVNAAHEVQPPLLGPPHQGFGDLKPEPLGLENLRRQVKGAAADDPLAADENLQVAGNDFRDLQAAEMNL